MNLKALKKPQLLDLATELRLDVTDALRKPELIQAILAVGADDEELSECIELINGRETAKRQATEAEANRQATEAEAKRQAAEAERQREESQEKKREHEKFLREHEERMREQKLKHEERERVEELERQKRQQEREEKERQHQEKMRWYDLELERLEQERRELEGERLQRENKHLGHEIQLDQDEVKPELELLLEKDLVVEESTVPALPVADARERESEVTVAAEQSGRVAERDNDGALAQTVGRGGRGQCVSTECDNVSAFVLEISAECSDGSNSREALGTATGLNMNISRDSEVSLECVSHEATERQHESAETEVVPSDGSAETSDVVGKPAVEAENGLHGSAGSHDDLATEQADSVLPPAQVADLEQRPAELVEIQASGAAGPSFETGQLGSSVALTAATQNENTLRCLLAEAVAESARDDEVVTVRNYQVSNEHVVPLPLPADAPEDRPASAELVEVPVSPVAEPKSGTDQPRGENVNTFRCSLAERVGKKASKKDSGKISARTCGACFSAGTPRGKAMSSHRAKGTPPPRRSARLTFERWNISLAPPRARPLSKTTAGVISRGRSSVEGTAADVNVNTSRDSDVSQECVNDELSETLHESAETEVVPSDGSAETSDVVAKPAAEAANGFHGSFGRNDNLATEQADSVVPPAQVADLERRPAELVEIQVSRAAEPSFENQTEQPGCSVVLAVRKQNGNTLRASRAEAAAVSARDDEVVTVRSYPVSKELVVPVSLPADAPDDRPTSAELVEVAVSTAAEPKSGTDQPREENVNAFRRLLAERVRKKASNEEIAKTSAGTCCACFSAGTRRGKAVSSHRARGTPPPKRSARLSFERWKISFAPPRARPLSDKTTGVISRGRSSLFQRTGAPKVRYKLWKARSNDESSNRSSQREKWLVDA
ncbi:uncharacterized protein LOC144148998 [Haemaphysalis longicornis]